MFNLPPQPYAKELNQWQSALGSNAELLIYGFNTAANQAVKDLVAHLNQLLGAEVAASSALIGRAALAGGS